METRKFTRSLRGAAARGDGAAVGLLLQRQPWPNHGLQLIGDALVVALSSSALEAPDLAEDCVRRLRERSWEGDDELADRLETMLHGGPLPMLRPLPVDLDELAMALEGDQLHGGGRLDLQTGEVWQHANFTGVMEDDGEDQDPDRWLWIECLGSRDGYRDMVDFINTVTDPGRVDRLGIAIEGRGAFRRFRDVLAMWPEEMDRWYEFSADRQQGRARAWLAMQGYHPSP